MIMTLKGRLDKIVQIQLTKRAYDLNHIVMIWKLLSWTTLKMEVIKFTISEFQIL